MHNKEWRKFGITIVLIVITIPSFFGIFILNRLGISTLTDMGILVTNIVKATDNTVAFDTMLIQNWISFAWWGIATMIITPYLLKDRNICCILYILGLCLPLMMIISASMYVSGGRVFWMSSVLFSSIIGMMLTEKFAERKLLLASCCSVIFGIYEIGVDAVYFINNMLS